MKVILVSFLVATLALAALANPLQEVGNSSNELVNPTPNENVTTLGLGQAMTEFLDAYMEVMKCGNEAMGIPPMAPLRLPGFNVNYSFPHISLNGKVKDIVITGLDKMVIINLSTDASNFTTFDILQNEMHFLAQFDINAEIDVAGFKHVKAEKGFINFKVMDQRVSGGFALGPNEVGGTTVSNMSYTIQIGDMKCNSLNTEWSVAVNNFVNQYICDAAKLFYETNRENINTIYSSYITPMLNKALLNVPASSVTSHIVSMTNMIKSMPCKKN